MYFRRRDSKKFPVSELVEVGRTISLVVLILSIMVSLNVKMALIASATLPILVVLAFWFFRVVEKNFKETDEPKRNDECCPREYYRHASR